MNTSQLIALGHAEAVLDEHASTDAWAMYERIQAVRQHPAAPFDAAELVTAKTADIGKLLDRAADLEARRAALGPVVAEALRVLVPQFIAAVRASADDLISAWADQFDAAAKRFVQIVKLHGSAFADAETMVAGGADVVSAFEEATKLRFQLDAIAEKRDHLAELGPDCRAGTGTNDLVTRYAVLHPDRRHLISEVYEAQRLGRTTHPLGQLGALAAHSAVERLVLPSLANQREHVRQITKAIEAERDERASAVRPGPLRRGPDWSLALPQTA